MNVAGVALGLAATLTTSGSAKDIDLSHWEYMPIAEVAPQLGNFSPAFLIAVRDGFLMVGSGGKGRRPESWYSRDGLAWERGNLGDAISDGYATDVVPRGRGALAMLIVRDRNGVPHSAIWEIADGRTWKMGRQLPADVAALPVPHLTAYQGDAIVVTSAGRLWIGEPGKPWRRTGPALRRDCHLDDAAPVDTPLGVLLLAGCPGGPEHGLSPGSVLLMDGKGVTHEITKGLPLMHVEAVAVNGRTVLVAGQRERTSAATLLDPPGTGHGEEGPPLEPVLYRSDDGGKTWLPPQPLAAPAHLVPGGITSMTAAGGGFAATGLAYDMNAVVPVPTVWASADGGSWQAHPLPVYAPAPVIGPMAVHGGRALTVAKIGYGPTAKLAGLVVNGRDDHPAGKPR